MPRYKVALYLPGAGTPNSFHDVSLATAQEAAEFAAGARLSPRGRPDQLRARVWLPHEPDDKTDFYLPK